MRCFLITLIIFLSTESVFGENKASPFSLDNKSDPQLYINAGMEAYYKKDYQSAIAWFDLALEKNLHFPSVFQYWKFLTLDAIGNEDEAKIYLFKAISSDHSPDHWKKNKTAIKYLEKYPILNQVVVMEDKRKKSIHSAFLMMIIAFILLSLKYFYSAFILKHKKDLYPAFLILAIAALHTSILLFWTHKNIDHPFIANLWHSIFYLIGPLFYISMLRNGNLSSHARMNKFHFLAFYLSLLCTIPDLTQEVHIAGYMHPIAYLLIYSPIFKTLHISSYFLVSILTYNNLKIKSDPVRIIYSGFSIYFGLHCIQVILRIFNLNDSTYDYLISGSQLLSIFTIFGIGSISLVKNKKGSLSDKTIPPSSQQSYETSNLTPLALSRIKMALTQKLEKEEVYLEPALSLHELSSLMDINKYHLSQAINQGFEMNFYELMNSYRIKHAAKILTDPKKAHYNILEVAYMSGFGNKASFNKYFRQHYACTPRQYKKNHMDSEIN